MILLNFILSVAFAKTNISVQEIAVVSNILLVAADQSSSDKKLCELTAAKVSELSQKLQSVLDEKVNGLKDADMLKLEEQAKKCLPTCTCSIYSLVLEKKGRVSIEIAKNAESIDRKKREVCLKKIKSPCKKLNFLDKI